MSKVHEIVTDKIITALSEGVVPWRKPWKPQAPRNYVSNRSYRGINRLLTELQPFSSPDWLTFNQIKAADGHIKKDESSTLITFYGTTKKNTLNEDEDAPRRGFLRYYLIFNLQQTEGVSAKDAEVALPLAIDAIKDGYVGPSYGGSPTGAHYIPTADRIDMPLPGAFSSTETYARILFHEMIHSTGHPSRLARFSVGDRPSEASYSKEELVAEIGAAMLMAAAGLSDDIAQSASYVDSWLKVLKGDVFMVVSAAAKAQKAVDFILGKNED